jgi:hypothetical protein
MKDNSLYKLGGICSIIVGISYAVIGITVLMESRALTTENNAQSPFMFFESNRVWLLAQYWAMALGAIFALAVIPAVSEKVRNLNEGWLRWTSTLATLGFAVTILDNYWAIVMTPARADAYLSGSQSVRAALTVPGAPQFIDVQGWLGYGAVGVWVIVVNLLALRGTIWPRLLAYLGIACAIAYFLVVASMVLPNLSGLILVVAGIGGVVLGPIWYIWIGLILRHNSSHQQTAAQLAHAADTATRP